MSQTAIVPEFIQNPVEELIGTDLNGTLYVRGQIPLNFIYWATAKTAKEIATRYGAQAVLMSPYYPAKNYRETFSPAAQWYLQFPDGTLMNAGMLADVFRRNPEQAHPGLADKMVKDLIAGAEAAR